MKRHLVVALVALLASAPVAAAQNAPDPREQTAPRPERPYRGLFGGNGGRPESKHKLNLRVSLFGSYDDNLTGDHAAGTQLLDPRAQVRGVYSGLSAGVDYQRAGRRISFAAGGGTSAHYYPDLSDFVALQHHANAALRGSWGATSISVAQGVQYAPFYTLRLLPGPAPGATVIPDVPTAGADGTLAIDAREAYLFNTGVGASHDFSSRSSISGNYGVRVAAFSSENENDLTSQQAGLHYRHQTSRYGALRAGYSIQQGRYATASGRSTVQIHSFDLGADYRRPLSFSRRTFINFNVGSSAVDGLSGDRVYRVVGQAGLSHEMGRTWKLQGNYHRGAGLMEGLAAPVFSDSVTATLGGFITRRLDLIVEGAFTEGEVGVTATRNPFDSVTGTARLRLGITRSLASFAEYFYHQYEFDRAFALPAGMPRSMDRQGVRVGLMLFLPVIQ